jgi:putative addiction module component (TIGR02574 family)
MSFLIAAKGYRRRAFNALSLRRLLNNCTVEFMVTVTDVEKVALDLSIPDRLVLISNLLQSLPPVLNDEDKGVAEALRRDAEMDEDTRAGLTLEEFEKEIERNRRGK